MHDLYRYYDIDKNLLYIGISVNAFIRFSQHKSNQLWASEIAIIEIEKYETRGKVLKAEKEAIKKEKPKYNITYNSIPIKKNRIPKPEIIFNEEVFTRKNLNLYLKNKYKMNTPDDYDLCILEIRSFSISPYGDHFEYSHDRKNEEIYYKKEQVDLLLNQR